MSDLLLPFAQRVSDDQFVSPEEVPRGLACDCVCPGCRNPVQARHGTERVWHFAHAKASDCADAYEKSVKETAKQMLRVRKELHLPPLVATAQGFDAFGHRFEESERIFEARHVILDTCRGHQVIGDVTPDLVGTLGGRQVLIELSVFHRLSPEKQERLVKTGLAVLEIDLRTFKVKQATRANLESALFSRADNRRWINHPAQTPVKERLEEALRQRLEKIEAKRIEEEKVALAARAANRAQLHTTVLRPSVTAQGTAPPGPVWRASFPPPDRWGPARDAFCERHGLSRARCDAVFDEITKRSELAHTTPVELADYWSRAMEVSPDAIFQFFEEAGYTL